MAVITESFQLLPIYDEGTKTFGWIHQPKVTIMIKAHGQLYPYIIEAFVDSGTSPKNREDSLNCTPNLRVRGWSDG